MRFGCDLPYYQDPADIRAFAQGAEELGFDQLGFSEHIAASRATEFPPGFRFDEPWHESTTLAAFLCAVTDRIEISPAVMLLTLRPPALVAKQLSELQILSNSRLQAVMSVGWNRQEQVALGVDPTTRAERFEESVPLIRRLLTEGEVTHNGRHFALDRIAIHPRPAVPPPIWFGGGNFGSSGVPSERTMRRAAQLADGFKLMAPTARDLDHTIRLAERLHELADAAGRTLQIEARLLTQLTPPDEWASVVRRYRTSGVITHVGLGNRIVGGAVADQLTLLRDVVERTRHEWE